jgi:hypothetical protein
MSRYTTFWIDEDKLIKMGYDHNPKVKGLLSILTKNGVKVHLTKEGYKIFINNEDKSRTWSKTNGDRDGSQLFNHIKQISRSNTINKILKHKL